MEYELPEQAEFRLGSNCCDQVQALMSYVETAFQQKLKAAAVFLDLISAYGTVRREKLIYKLLRIIPRQTRARLLQNMLCNRCFKVVLGEKISDSKVINNGLPRGSILASFLSNLCTSDLPTTQEEKSCYTDNITLATRYTSLNEAETILNNELAVLDISS